MPFRFSELREAMTIIVGRHKFPGHRFCFFIDGLDEFEAETTDDWELAQMLQMWASSNDVKICVSSRPYTEFLEVFNGNLRMELHRLTRGDIERFTSVYFDKSHHLSTQDEDFTEIINDIVESADGVFLWVRLVVRSLLDGVRHRSSLPTLKEKLKLIPRGLDSLFDKMFNNIDPADRGRSDRMLMLAASSKKGKNALLYSWLENLEDPEFPYDAPIKAYWDEEIKNRHTNVRAQLDSLSKGLLEMKPSRWSRGEDSGTLASKDIYFRYEVDFFHRSVRDYLTDPCRYTSMKGRLGEFDMNQAYRRLLLADFKFARTTDQYLKLFPVVNAFNDCFFGFFRENPLFEEIPPRMLDECGKILEHHRQNPFSHPDETIRNSGVVPWGLNYNAKQREPQWSRDDISYPHRLAYLGQHNYVMAHFMSTETLTPPVHERCLLLTSSISPRNNTLGLICDLLKHGASPNHHITVISADNPEENRVTTVWAVFLIIVCQDVFSLQRRRLSSSFSISAEESQCYFLTLEEYLRSGADNDVCFFFDKETEDTASHSDDMIMVTLEELIIIEQPSNSGRLLELAAKGKGSLFWNGSMQLLSTLRPWIGGLIGTEQNYRKSRLDDLRAETATKWVLKSVCIRGDWLESDFVVKVF